ncbi:MAG: DeoR/GlpR family DNA-binding transcription regulator [Proteobacteria bacterium]|nr:DeoR/GlpR family DNA-binding transcription regulator [Pseudomonadota bacterium]
MRPADRHRRIIELVSEQERVTVDGLAELLDTSRETVRRDLGFLSEQGLLRKIHGGATAAQNPASVRESPLGERRANARDEKMRIAVAAAALFTPGDSILINCGTTTIFFAEELARRGPFTIITNSTLVAHEMWGSAQRGPIHLLGGSYFGEAYELLGPQVVEQIKEVSSDHAVIGVSGIGSTGAMMDFNADEAYVSRAMIESAREVTVVADSSKLQRNALFHVCGPEKIDRLVTDRAPDAALESALRLAGVEIVVAESRP